VIAAAPPRVVARLQSLRLVFYPIDAISAACLFASGGIAAPR
jgi:hypothetical protein